MKNEKLRTAATTTPSSQFSIYNFQFNSPWVVAQAWDGGDARV
jgi:hypothetical protein